MTATFAMLKNYLGERVQLAYVVSDVDLAIRYWTEVLRVGPFVVIEHSRGDRKIVHRGRETNVDFVLAFSYMGDVQIELIHQTNDEPSSYKEFLDAGHEGLHHVGFWPDDMDSACAYLEANGFAEVTAVLSPDGSRSVVYYDAPAFIGSMVEVLPMNASREAYYGRIKRLAQSWDGVSRPARRFADRAGFLASGEGAGD